MAPVIMGAMVSSVIASVTAALITLVVGHLTVAPRIDARKDRIKVWHCDRDKFEASLRTILANYARFQAMQIPGDASKGVRKRLKEEQARWLGQIDEETRWMVDNTERFAFGYVNILRNRDLLLQYAMVARGIMISDRDDALKVQMLGQLTEPIQTFFFARWWRLLAKFKAKAQLISMLNGV